MTKSNGNGKVKVISSIEISSAEFTTSSGRVLKLVGIPPLLVPQIYNTVVFPTVPTYAVDLPNGEKQYFPHEVDPGKNVSTLKDDADVAAWKKYQEDLEKASTELNNKLNQAIILEGVQYEEDPDDFSKWKRHQKLLGIQLPEDEDEIELLYKQTHLIGTIEDLRIVMQTVMELTGISTEEVFSTKSSFPDSVESES